MGIWRERNWTLVLTSHSYPEVLGCFSKTKENRMPRKARKKERPGEEVGEGRKEPVVQLSL